MQIEKERKNGVVADFLGTFKDCWKRLPNKAFFFLLLAAWLALFYFLGNATLGYIKGRSTSLYAWMLDAYDPEGKFARSDDGHGVLIPFVVLVLFWMKREKLLAQPLRIWTPALFFVGFGLLLHVAGYMGQQPKISVVAFFIGIYGLTGLAWGPAWLKTSLFPFFLFGFCVPLGLQAQFISFPLRLLVTRLVEWFSNGILAIDVQRNGTSLINAASHYQYEVAAACSGLRSLIATFAISVIYSFVSFQEGWKRLVLIVSAFPLAVLGNFVRMMTIIIAAEIGGQDWGNYIHEGGPGGILSLLPYIPAFAGLLLVGHWLRSRPQEQAPLALQVQTP